MLKPSSLIACGVLLLTSCGGPAETSRSSNPEPYQAPTYCLGDTWIYRVGENFDPMTHSVLRVADGLVEMDARTIDYCLGCRMIFDRTLVLQQTLRADGTPLPGSEERKFYEFPLTVGKTWQYSIKRGWDLAGAPRNGSGRLVESTTFVEAYEDVTVPAGTFSAFRIRTDLIASELGFRLQYGAPRWSERRWFAPAVKWVVKFQTASPYPPGKDWELSSYSLGCPP